MVTVKILYPRLNPPSLRITGLIAIVLSWLAVPVLGQDDAADMKQINPRIRTPLEIDEELVNASGIIKLTGKHLDLYADVRDRAEIFELVTVFDQAVDQWCNFFSIQSSRTESWRMRAFVIEDRQRFKTAGLVPDDLPDFLAGYQRGHEIWIYLQPGNYYTRHLLLHEGTHAFMGWFLNGFGSPWYSEGMAELLAVHQWKDGKLNLHYELKDRSEAEYWGRVKIIRREVDAGTALSLSEVFAIPAASFREVRYYAWSWAACEFLANHPISKTVFGELNRNVELPANRFDAVLKERLLPQWETLNRDWNLYLSELDYGYDVGKGRLVSANLMSSGEQGAKFQVRADHSWQSTSLTVKQGDQLRVSASGRFQIGKTTKPWPCEANGITIEYYHGRPLGMLLAGVLDSAADLSGNLAKSELGSLLDPVAVGQDAIIEISRPGLLCLRINESPAKMYDNAGVLEVTIDKLE